MNTGSVLARFTITLSDAVTEPVQVEWYTSDGTAKAGVDYAANKGTVIFSPGQSSKTVDILVYGRAVGTEDRSFFVEMLPPTNAILGSSIGECIITVDTSGSTPVTQIVVPSGPVGPQGKSSYQSYLDTTTDNPPKTEAEWVESLKGDPAEIAMEVAPLIDVGSTTLTAQGTESLGKPDATTVKAIARRVAYAGGAKVATVLLNAGDNLLTNADLSGDAVDFMASGFVPKVLHAGAMSEPLWEVDSSGKLLIKGASAGDTLYAVQYDFIAKNNRLARLAELNKFKADLQTSDGYKFIGEVASFAELRALQPSQEGVRVKLRGYYSGSNLGGGDFIGHIGSATDNGGTIASGAGFYWTRDIYGIVDVLQFGARRNGSDDTASFMSASSAFPGGVYVPPGNYLIPNNITGRFWGPGKRLQTTGGDPIPFTNPGQSHGNLFLGYDAGKNYAGDDITGQVIGLGPGACRNVSTGYNITAIGAGVLTGDTLVDSVTDTSPCTGFELIGIGVNALKKAVTLNNSIGIGRDALNENKFGQFNIGIGSSALQQLHTGSGNVALGRAAGMRAGMITDPAGIRIGYSTVNGCTFIGNAAGRETKSGDFNTYVGNNAGRGVTSTTNSYTGTATGNGNVALGADALNGIVTASNNVAIGMGAAQTLESGSGNIFIGKNAGAGVTSADNRLIIANQGSLPYLDGLMGPVGDVNNYARFDASVQAATDNTRTLGSGSRRWAQLFAATATINTSDGRVKTDISVLEEAEKRVAQKLKGMMRRFRYTEAVVEKEANGETARWHFGVIAQEVQQAFADEGLDSHEYGLFCHDTWDTEYVPVMAIKTVVDKETGIEYEVSYDTGEKRVNIEGGDRYGIRYEELLCFIIAAI